MRIRIRLKREEPNRENVSLDGALNRDLLGFDFSSKNSTVMTRLVSRRRRNGRRDRRKKRRRNKRRRRRVRRKGRNVKARKKRRNVKARRSVLPSMRRGRVLAIVVRA